MNTLHIIHRDGDGNRTKTTYTDVLAIEAGRAADVLGKADCDGNGIAYDAPVIQLRLAGGQTATYDADNVRIMF